MVIRMSNKDEAEAIDTADVIDIYGETGNTAELISQRRPKVVVSHLSHRFWKSLFPKVHQREEKDGCLGQYYG